MDLRAAEALTQGLMTRHGLTRATGWEFGWMRSSRAFGRCRYRKDSDGTYAGGKVELSTVLTALNEESEVRETALHEIAHALTPGHGHDSAWRRTCRLIGAVPRRCYDMAVVRAPRLEWEARCPGPCGRRLTARKPPRHRKSCVKCGGNRFDPRYVFSWVRVADVEEVEDMLRQLSAAPPDRDQLAEQALVKQLRAEGLSYMAIEAAMGWPDSHGNRAWKICRGKVATAARRGRS